MIGEKLGPYEILESIGSGGMGEVWKARDTRLGRIVAIKKVNEQHSERFKQEARSIAALNHPNICQIFDIGDDYLVLEYVEGKPLSSPLPEQEAVKIAIQIATALEAAHKKGVIHRDLKPGNIMVTYEGSVKLLDFGLAKLYGKDTSISSVPTEDFPATQAGAIMGTVAYMSPEQAQGQPADARSDIFSFGLVLYEMLSGKRAFSRDSTPETMAALLRDEPVPLKASPPLEKIMKRCLEKKPIERYQTMSEVKAALEKAVKPKVTASFEDPQPSIAVLPFADMSPGRDNEWFGDGLAEEIINALANISGLRVAARTSSFFFRGKDADIHDISDRLKVKTILEGSVRKSGNHIRVTAQLINAVDGYHLWSERYDRDMTDVFAIQDEICHAIVDKLSVRLAVGGLPVKHQTKNMEAHNLYLKGRYHLTKFTREGFEKGKEYFEQAIALDSDYALAWYGLAWFYFNMDLLGYMAPQEAHAQYLQAARKALALNNTLPQNYCIMAMIRAVEFDWKSAEKEFEHALRLDPKSSDAWRDYEYWFLIPRRRFDEAIEAAQKALEFDPLSPFLKVTLGHGYWQAGKPEDAIEQYSGALELDPQYFVPYLHLGIIYAFLDRYDEAIRAAEISARLSGHSALALGVLGYVYAKAGRTEDAHRILRELFQSAQVTYVPSLSIGFIYLGLGEIDKSFDWWERAVDEHYTGIATESTSPAYDPLRSHPRYKAVLRKMNLEP